ncbi:uncharacterized protein LOC103704911 [Phoenix dactylifera]|uniref:Uncharacterized protein LOC103704911 n=1 Tax=Phoenix dactylifera TaxID=42345 RepID=A0A8B7BW51_PHODC|nr:uncharacterized protein LOC103704911 [Phoenix dactylifera]
MCPLRLILVFLSATLAGYFAWKTVRSPPPNPIFGDSSEIEDSVDGDSKKRRRFDARKVIGDGFWVFLDMASGRYLWRVMKGR